MGETRAHRPQSFLPTKILHQIEALTRLYGLGRQFGASFARFCPIGCGSCSTVSVPIIERDARSISPLKVLFEYSLGNLSGWHFPVLGSSKHLTSAQLQKLMIVQPLIYCS